ncbi:DUF4124 domain-containing protein [Maricurvus nonylphenolicus]|uniref:DUF4124 domain-containing protein n=1 Tax=Maricurvus nonylphenolicus TaxID=1008307 RepID=UPI0036F3FF1B
MKRALTLSALLLLASSPLLLNAQIYQSIDEDGNVIYTDQPPKGQESQEVKLRPTNTTPPLATPKQPEVTNPDDETTDQEEEDAAPEKYKISISSPTNEAQIPMGQRDVNVSVSLEPSLHADHRVQIYMNGAKQGEAMSGTSKTLKEVYRGAHTIKAAVVDKKGKTISSSESVTIYVQRPSVLFPKPKPTPSS